MTFREFLGGDLTPLEHVIYGVVIQIIVTIVLWWLSPMLAIGAGAAAPIGLYFGREHAQQQHYFSKTEEPLGDLEAAKFWKWDYPSKMDLYCPACVSVLLGLILYIIFH